MRLKTFAIMLLALAVTPGGVAVAKVADAEAGLAAVKALGRVNGQALACSELQVVARAKSLMLAHASKTALYGSAYEEATQAAYLAQTRSAEPCPRHIVLLDSLNTLALQLAAALPVAAAEAK